MTVRADAPPLTGREGDLAAVAALLRSADARLVTVVGPAGVGKTRLAEEIAATVGSEVFDDVAYVDVGPIPAHDLVLPAIAQALGATGEAVRATIEAAVADRKILLILDDVDEAAAPAVAEIIPLFGRGRVLATGEKPVDLAEERVYALAVLDDGLPLVAELAAALPAQIPAEKPATIAGVLDLAYDSLEPRVQRCFARLSVFAGGWTVETAETVCVEPVADVLSTLEERRLIHSAADPGRFAMHPAIRSYAAGQLDRLGEADEANRTFAESLFALLESGRLEARVGNAPAREWRAELETEANNLRAALVWAEANDRDLLARMVAGAWWFYRNSSQTEAKLWLERALATPAAAEPALRGDLLEGLTVIVWETGDGEKADALAQEMVAVRREVDDPAVLRRTLVLAGITASVVGDFERAIPLYEEARELARAADDAWALCWSTFNLADTLFARRDVERAEPLFEEAGQLFTDADLPTGAALARGMLGYVALSKGDLGRAQGFFRETIEASRTLGTLTELILGLEGLAWLAVERKELERAARLLGAAERVRELGGFPVQDSERPFRERVITAVEGGGATLATARAAGHRLEQDEAAAYALSD